MSTPTMINEEYDIVIAGGEHHDPTLSVLSSANNIDFDRRHGCVRCCQSSD